MNEPVSAWIGLGANLGSPTVTLPAALDALDTVAGIRLVRASRLYRTAAWGQPAQPDFVNAVALVDTTLDARVLLDALLGMERKFGRERRERWGPRLLDLDLLLYGHQTIDEPGLRVPHPHLHERAFALLPMLEIDEDVAIPGRGSARAALGALAYDAIQALG